MAAANGETYVSIPEKSLECPVCLTAPKKGPIYLCHQGHSLCHECKAKMDKCPECRGALSDMRNYALESILENKFAASNENLSTCKFKNCQKKLPLWSLTIHENEYHLVPCFVMKCQRPHPRKMTLEELKQHLKNDHGASISALNDENKLYFSGERLYGTLYSTMSQFEFMSSTYFVVSRFGCNELNVQKVLVISSDPLSDGEASKIKYEVKIILPNNASEMSYKGSVLSIYQSQEYLRGALSGGLVLPNSINFSDAIVMVQVFN